MKHDDEQIDQSADEIHEDFAALLEANLSGPEKLHKGQAVEAMVVKISSDSVFIDTGRKGEGILPREEFRTADGELSVKEGDSIRAFYLGSIHGEARFTTRMSAKGGGGSPQIEEAWRSGIPVEGVVEKEIKGGFEVRLSGSVRSFCPSSQIDLYRGDVSAYVHKCFSFKVTQYGEQGRNIIVSRRVLQEEEREQARLLLREKLREGMTVSGVVRSLQPFGAFVVIDGGIDGLVPISELAWGRVDDPSEIVAIGQRIDVVIKKLDWDANKFTLSLRDAGSDPWQGVNERYREGSFHVGKVVRLAQFGGFVNLEPGIDGLVHISKLSPGKRIQHPREVIKEGDTLEVRIDSIDQVTRRISLSLAAQSRAAAAAEQAADEARQYAQQTDKISLGSLADKFRAASKRSN